METAAAHKLTTRQALLAASTLAQSNWSAVSIFYFGDFFKFFFFFFIVEGIFVVVSLTTDK